MPGDWWGCGTMRAQITQRQNVLSTRQNAWGQPTSSDMEISHSQCVFTRCASITGSSGALKFPPPPRPAVTTHTRTHTPASLSLGNYPLVTARRIHFPHPQSQSGPKQWKVRISPELHLILLLSPWGPTMGFVHKWDTGRVIRQAPNSKMHFPTTLQEHI